MSEHWLLVQNKPYPKFKGVWQKRHILPITFNAGFEGETGVQPLEIPLVGGGHIRLGVADEAGEPIAGEVKYPTARGDEEMRVDRFTIFDDQNREGPYPFEIFYDREDQDERMKFLSRMDPEKDIDWDNLKPETDEYEIAKAFTKYKKFEAEPKDYIYTKN